MYTILLLCRVQIIAHCVVVLQTRLGSRENIFVYLAEPVGGVKIWRNLIGLPLQYVVNNSDIWMRKAWEWRGASQVVWTCFGTRLLQSIICNRLALWRIYSTQQIQNREQATFCAINLLTITNRNIGVIMSVGFVYELRISKSKLFSVFSFSKEPFPNTVFYNRNQEIFIYNTTKHNKKNITM